MRTQRYNSPEYYIKDKKAQIYKFMNVSVGGGMPRDQYIPIAAAPLWCYTSQLSQNRIYQALGVGKNETRYFVFNYLKNVEVNDALLYRGNWYNITRVDTKDDYNTDTFIYVENMDNPPSEEDILTYEDGAQYL